MDFNLDDDRRMLSDTLQRFLSDQYPIETRHKNAEAEDGYSPEMWQQFAELGIIGALFDEDVGGFGGSGIDLSVVFEQFGRSLVVEPLLPCAVLAGSILAELGNENQKSLIESIVAGELKLALAHGEPDARYELNKVSTHIKDGTISGYKSVVLGGNCADKLLVSVRESGDAESDEGISIYLVDRDAEGVTIRSFGTVDGYPAAEISLYKVTGELIGTAGKAFDSIEMAYSRGNVALCAEALGAMEVAKDMTVEYMHTRKQFGVPIGKFQALQHRMADILIEIEQMRSAVINAVAGLGEDRVNREKAVSAAKHLAGKIGRQVAEEAIQIHGGNGMTWEYAVGHYSKRLIMIDHLLGDTDHHLERYISLN